MANNLLLLGCGAAGSGASSFSPLDLSLLLWLDRNVGAYQERSSPSTPATGADDPAGTVEDQSAAGNDCTAPTDDTTRPLVKLAVQNGLNVLRFDGTNDALRFPNVTLTTDFAALVVFRFQAGQISSLLSVQDTLLRVDSDGWLSWYPNTGTTKVDFTAQMSAGWHYVSIVQAGTAYDLRVDGVASTGTTAAIHTVNTVNAVGAFANNGIWNLLGDIGEVVLGGTAWTAGEMTSLEAYIQDKWGL